MSEDQRPDAAQTEQNNPASTDGAETAEGASEAPPDARAGEPDDGAESFPREYVEKLRKENAAYRQKAKDAEARADTHARDLFTARVEATGLLADARDMPYMPDVLDDETELRGCIAALLDERPHLKARKVAGDVGQGRRDTAEPVNLMELLRGR